MFVKVGKECVNLSIFGDVVLKYQFVVEFVGKFGDMVGEVFVLVGEGQFGIFVVVGFGDVIGDGVVVQQICEQDVFFGQKVYFFIF